MFFVKTENVICVINGFFLAVDATKRVCSYSLLKYYLLQRVGKFRGTLQVQLV